LFVRGSATYLSECSVVVFPRLRLGEYVVGLANPLKGLDRIATDATISQLGGQSIGMVLVRQSTVGGRDVGRGRCLLDFQDPVVGR
jgi:hypothetical protein